MQYSRIVVGTDVEMLFSSMKLIDVSVEYWNQEAIQGNLEDFSLDPTCLYVFAYVNQETTMLPFMLAKAGATNFLAFLTRPGNGFLSCNNELEKITLLSPENMLQIVLDKIFSAMEEK